MADPVVRAGSQLTINVTFTLAGVPTDPTAVVFSWSVVDEATRTMAIASGTYPNGDSRVIHDGPGAYHVVLDTTGTPGLLIWEFASTGAVEQVWDGVIVIRQPAIPQAVLGGPIAPNPGHYTTLIVDGATTFTAGPISFPAGSIAVADVAGAAVDATVIHLAGAELVTGVKTFSVNPVLNAGAIPESAVASLTTDLAAKALDSAVVHKTGDETVAGVKTFSSAPTFPVASVADEALSENVALLNENNVFAASQTFNKATIHPPQTPTEAVLVSGIDASLSEEILVTLMANRVMGVPLNGVAGQRLHLVITEGGAGGFALTFGAGITVTNFGLNMAVDAKTDAQLTCVSAGQWVIWSPSTNGQDITPKSVTVGPNTPGPGLVNFGDYMIPNVVAGLSGNAALCTANQTALQAAIDAANAAGGGRILIAIAGTVPTSPLTMRSDVYLEGVGVGATILMLADGANADLIAGLNFGTLTGGNTTGGIFNWSIRNLILDGNKANQSGTSFGLRFYGADMELGDLRIRNFLTDGMWSEWGNQQGSSLPDKSMEGRFHDVKIHDCGGNGWHNRGPHDSIVDGVIIFNNGAYGYWSESGALYSSNGALITNSHVWGSSHTQAWVIDAENQLVNCKGEGASVGQLLLRSGKIVILGGDYFAAGSTGYGIKVGDAGLPCSNSRILTRTSEFTSTTTATAHVWIANSAGSNVIDVMAVGSSGTPLQGTPVNTDFVRVVASGMTNPNIGAASLQQLYGPTILETGSSANAFAIKSGGTGHVVVNTASKLFSLAQGYKSRWFTDAFSVQTAQIDGATGKFSGPDAGIINSNSWLPADNGLLASSGDPAIYSLTNALLVAGTLYLVKLPIRYAMTISNLWFNTSVVGIGASSTTFCGLYDSSGNLLTGSADVHTPFLTAGPTGALALTQAQALTAGAFVWAALLVNLVSTQPSLFKGPGNVATATSPGLTAATYRWATNGTGLAALPGAIVPANNAATTLTVWCGAS